MKSFEYKKIGLLIALVFIVPGCFWKSTNETKSAQGPEMYVVNVLSKELYNDAHIKGSMHLDLDDLDAKIDEWNKSTPVVFYCSNYHCTASSHAARQFKKAGFQHVYAYEGGTAEWAQLSKNDPSYMLEGPATESYLTQEVSAPEQEHDIEIISAADLKDKMQKAGLLS